MEGDYLGNLIVKTQPMVDFNCHIPKAKSSKRIMYELFSHKGNSKNLLNLSYNPEDIFNANNEINSILSKNLKSIINENKNENAHDIPLFQNIDSLIQKNHNDNHYFYNQMLYYHNNLNLVAHNPIYYSHINPISESALKNSDIISTKNQALNDAYLSHTSIKDSIGIIKRNNQQSINKLLNRKFNHNYNNQKNITKKNRNIKKTRSKNTKTNISANKHVKLDTQKTISGTYDILGNNSNKELKNLLNENLDKTKIHNSGSIHPNFLFSGISQRNNKKINEVHIISNNLIKPSFNKKKFFSINNDFKFNSSIKPTIPNRLEFLDLIHKNNSFHHNQSITKSYIEKKLPLIKRELDDLNNNDISEIIDKLPKNKSEQKKINKLDRINLYQNINMNNSEQNELIPSIDKNEIKISLEDDKFQKKYRKLFLNKNLYDSLDDEEVIDEEKIYNFYLSTNSITIYILDSFVLIALIIVLYYLPIYTSLYISSFKIYHNLGISIIFYITDIIYIIDLISGFFRAYYNFEEVLIKKNTDIYLHYLTGWFILDIIEAIPFFTLLDHNMRKLKLNFLTSNKNVINIYDFGLNNKYFALTFLKVIKIFKIFNSNITLKAIKKYFDKSRFFYEWKGLFSAILIILSSLHFFSCFFIFIGRNQSQGWIVHYNFQNNTFIDLYITALYYLITTLTTVGYGDISGSNFLEKIYGTFTLIVGTCAYSWILTYISNYIKKNNEKYIEFEKKMKILNEIKLEYTNLNKNLNNRIIRYLNYNKSENKYNLKFILESLPSSLQNNLIIEIYKPIIQNFQFFKSFENSDFFVKIVTSLKPILSMKEDILIQEGDIIEDIIFIKTGVLTLEIIIDLNEAKKSIESHLEMTGMECFKSISYNKFTTLRHLNSMTTNFRGEFGNKIFNEKIVNEKEIKIIDLRKNEHFGDILMILNEKSPLTVKVKSKKAELFFLQKTEATEISNRYPNIWKRIVNRSLHNMKQIKNLIKKKLFLFAKENKIEINPEFKKDYERKKKATFISLINNLEQEYKNGSDNIDTIIEEESNIFSQVVDKNMSKNSKITTGKIFDNKNRTINRTNLSKNSNLYNTRKLSFENIVKLNDDKNYEDDEKSETDEDKIFKNSETNNSLNDNGKNIEINNNITGVEDIINSIDKKEKKSNIKIQINQNNINNCTSKFKIPRNQINIENNYSNGHSQRMNEEIYNSFFLGRINSEISYKNDFMKDINNNDILMDNSDDNNTILLSNMQSKGNKKNKTESDKNDLNSNTESLKKNNSPEKNIKNEKIDIKTNDKISNKSISNNKSEKSEKNIRNENPNKFNYLDASQSMSFTINSTYENINQISKYTYEKNSHLREKIKKIILEQMNNENKCSHSMSIISKNNKKKLFGTKYGMKFNPKKLLRKKTESLGINRKIINNTLNLNIKSISKKSLLEGENKISSNLKTSGSVGKSDVYKFRDLEKNILNDEKKYSNDIIKNISPLKNKQLKRHKSMVENEKTFYNKINRIKTMKKKNINIQAEKIEKETKISKMNYNRLISKNIEKNQQNLNNPVEYFEGFFNDIIFNKKCNNLIDNGNEDIKKKKTIRNKYISE